METAITTVRGTQKRTKTLSKKSKELDEEFERVVKQAKEDEILDSFINIANEHGYTKKDKDEFFFNEVRPYLISQEAFAEYDDYEALSLTYFADGVLTDEDYEIIKDPGYLVGPFEEWFSDRDVIYVRCDERCADYEIAKDIRTYAEVYNTLPHMKWRQNE